MRAKKSPPRYARLVSLLLCLAIAATLIPSVPFTLGEEAGVQSGLSADGKTYYISTFNELMTAAGHSKTAAGNTIRYVLLNDIDIDDVGKATLQGLDIDHLTFGDEDHYFLGEFDGGGHTISGLDYANKTFKIATRTGLFSYVGHKDAMEALKYNTYIHDLTIKDASMHADYLSGIVAGEVYNTRFVNVNVVDSAISVNPADNAVLLITDGGVIGGAIAGFARHCTFYNCGTRNTTVRTNSVSGVAAVAGKPLYLGGLVGQADTFTEIEYCRVMGGAVKNRYESSVGAVGGFTCYAGGLAGDLTATKVIDCFATCDVSFHAATYVGVAAGCSGHAGGLVGKTDADDNGGVIIRRCHYADGKISSYQYNTLLLMIPIQIANDVNRSGLVDKCDHTTVEDSFFNYADTIGPKGGKPADVLGSKTATSEYGPQPDEQYEDREFWENRGYDFAGNIDRSTGSNTLGPHLTPKPYFNKWVMYYYDDPDTGIRRAYPVHGLSVAATFDFPGAGSVTLKPTLIGESLSLPDGVTTTDPYRFATLGIYPTECTPVTYTNGTETKGGVALSAVMNEGYRLKEWYLEPDIAAAGLPSGQHDYFDKIFAADPSKLKGDLAVTDPTQVSYPHVAVADNQLYIARCQALVEFCGLDGGTLNKTSGAAEGTADLSDDWYYYGELLPAVTPAVGPRDPDTGLINPNAKLIGWTTIPDTTPDSVTTPGWEKINTTQLDKLKADGDFYEPGMPIVSTLKLYPVYADLVSNVFTEIEGYDDKNNKTLRTGVGQTYVTSAGDAITLGVKSFATATEADQPTADFPDGYRFLGWYEVEKDNEGNITTAHCVSRERDYTLPATVDLSRQHIYQARFEYRVDYYLIAQTYDKDQSGTPFVGGPCTQLWQLYGSRFNASASLIPEEYHFVLEKWYQGAPTGIRDEGCGATEVPAGQTILAPYVVHAHTKSTGAGGIDYNFYITTDFPGSGTITQTGRIASNNYTVKIATHDNYNFLFWASGRPKGGHATCATPEWWLENDWMSTFNYGLEAHMTANVVFHTKDDQVKQSVQRRYKEAVFLPEAVDYTQIYKYPISETGEKIEPELYQPTGALPNPPSEAFPFTTDMNVDGNYYFIGWIDKDDPDTIAALRAIYNVPDDPCTTTNVALAKNYILTEGDIVTRAMPSVYPVYAKYDIETDTNVELTVEGVVAQPDNPGCVLADGSAEQTTATITAYNNIAVNPSKPEGEKYTVEAITVSIDGGKAEIITAHETDDQGNWVIKYTVLPGKHYLFTAIYQPHVVIFHQSNTDKEVLLRTYGQPVGRPAPKEAGGVSEPVLPTVQNTATELAEALFVGWTETRPGNPTERPYHFFPTTAEKSSYALAGEFGYWTPGQTEDTIVTHSMELWPVYAEYTVTVNSNIDKALKAEKPTLYPDDVALWRKVRSLARTGADAVSATVHNVYVEDYRFVGWYTGVTQSQLGGEYDNFDGATLVSDSETYTLEGVEPFTAKRYTARYRKVYKVIYHNRGKYLNDPTKDPVIHIDYLYEGQDEDKSLNILRENVAVKKPILDGNGNPTYDENGEPLEETVYETYHEPLNPLPYHMIYATMNEYESFGQWECHDPTVSVGTNSELVNVYPYSFDKLLPQSGGDPNDPKTKGLIARVGKNEREINLYPTVWTVTVRDSNNHDITGDVKVDIDMSAMDPQSTSYENVKVNIYFDPAHPYTQSKLTVRVQRTRWVETNDPNKPNIANRGRNGVEVFLYSDTSKKLQLAQSKDTANLKGLENDEENDGYAVFEFTDSPLKLTKNAPADRKGDTFLFQVTNTADKTKTWTVPVTCDAETKNAENVVTGCTGSATIKLPVGTYSVTEAEDWTWRLKPVYTVRLGGVLQEASDAHKAVALGSVIPAEPTGAAPADAVAAEVVCTNSDLGGAQWSWKTDRKKNLFNSP